MRRIAPPGLFRRHRNVGAADFGHVRHDPVDQRLEGGEVVVRADLLFVHVKRAVDLDLDDMAVAGRAPVVLRDERPGERRVSRNPQTGSGQCGLDPVYKRRYPHQFSGGQRQRLGIARALAVRPEFIVCDESVAALDVSIQAQILNLFMDLRETLDLTYLFISHELGVVEHLSDRVVIMYLGRVVESASTDRLFDAPNHPYTQALLREVPRLESRHAQFEPIKGEIPSPLSPPSGCHFHPRCPHATQRCREQAPSLSEIQPGWLSACHLNDE